MLFDLNGEHEGDPLIVAGIWGVISALHPVKVHNTLYVSLDRFIIGGSYIGKHLSQRLMSRLDTYRVLMNRFNLIKEKSSLKQFHRIH